ncbi:DUF177 domain-containing protein [Acetobacter sp. AN02]|uniref:YceD family protein n=1 Tax=Acetobacter sp. AN02 TaxID=2894186 RepID=UPI0024346441|nr:DUF177 domain-containing protein [Acetobacter sp. AN02]MDG6095355.1 DUF177 domain-containing protein [Acetobacter sp. AN02]
MVQHTAEFSRKIMAVRAVRHGMDMTVEASAEECAALAARFDLEGIRSFSCRFILRPGVRHEIEAECSLSARVVQRCVVTLEPFGDVIVERFSLRLVPEDAVRPEDFEDPDAESDVIPFSGDSIDLGEIASEQLGLILDPYPRSPGAALPEGVSGDETDETDQQDRAPHPFASLARLKGKE